MDAALATVTVISLSMAFTMGVVAWRLLREERRRADARVTVLMADLERARDPHVSPVALAAPHGSTPPPRVRTATSAPPRGQTASARPKTRPVPSTGEVVVSRARVAQSTAGLFAQITGSSRSLHPLVVTVATAVVILAAISATMLFGLPALSGDTPTGLGVGATGPVELLSLAHTRTGDYLAISGSLRNPPDGVERGQLSVTAVVFDRDGAVVGTGQTPLPVAVLPPGSETSFTISLPDADRINRYRVGFVHEQTSVPHLDRREPNAEARPGQPPAPTGDRP